MTVKIQIMARFSDTVRFECELGDEWASRDLRTQRGEAIRRAILCGSDLRGSDLSGSNLSGSDLCGSDLRGSDLSGSNLSDSNLSGSNLSGSNLRGSNLRDSNLSGSDLSGSDLSGSNLSGSNLSGSNLSGSKIVRVVARVGRLDGYEFIAFETDRGTIIRAGCRTMSPTEYREHVAREYPGTNKAEETLAILDYIEARAAR